MCFVCKNEIFLHLQIVTVLMANNIHESGCFC